MDEFQKQYQLKDTRHNGTLTMQFFFFLKVQNGTELDMLVKTVY